MSEDSDYADKSYEKEEKALDDPLPTLSTNKALGHVVQGEEKLTVNLQEDARIECFVHKEAREDVKLGTYVQIPLIGSSETLDKNLNDELLGIVQSLQYVNKSKTNEYNKDPSQNPTDKNTEENYALVARIEPINIIRKDMENGKIQPQEPRTLDTIPKPYTRVYQSDNKKFLRTGLKIPKNGISVGYMSNNGQKMPKGNPLVYKLQNEGHGSGGESIIWRHSLICGSTGTGKTHSSKNILRQLHKSQKYDLPMTDSESASEPCVIIIDPEDEYGEMKHDPDYSEKEKQEKLDELKSKQGVEVGGIDELKIFQPEIKNSSDVKTGSTEREGFHIEFELAKERMELLLPFDAEMPTRNAMKAILGEFFSKPDRKKTYEEFQNWIKNTDEEILKGKYNIGDRMWGAAMRRLKDNKTFSTVFDASDQSLRDTINDIVQSGQVSVIPTKNMNASQQKLVVMSIMSIIADNKLGTSSNESQEIKENIQKTPIVLAIDEAHNYLASSADNNVRDRYILNKFINIAKQGRKYKTGLFMITQNPEDIHPEIMKQTNTRFYMGLEGEILDSINESKEVKKKVQNFGKGQMMVKSPGIRPVEIEGFEVCLTKHG